MFSSQHLMFYFHLENLCVYIYLNFIRYLYLISSCMYLSSAENNYYSSCIKFGKQFSPKKFQIEEKGGQILLMFLLIFVRARMNTKGHD
jgi:hypothetical protein